MNTVALVQFRTLVVILNTGIIQTMCVPQSV